jgi:hypothetical protein
VEEVVIQPGGSALWQRTNVSALDKAQLLGEAP